MTAKPSPFIFGPDLISALEEAEVLPKGSGAQRVTVEADNDSFVMLDVRLPVRLDRWRHALGVVARRNAEASAALQRMQPDNASPR